MISTARILLKARITAFNPWKHRPSGLQIHSRPQMVHPGHHRSGYRKQNPDDPTRTIKPSHVLLKRCPSCKRTQFVPLADKHVFHTCCEGVPMRDYTNMQTVMDAELKMRVAHRQWDVENDRPWSNSHRPRPKGRSKLRKK